MVVRHGIVLIAAGLAIGLVLAWTVTRATPTMLYGVGATDPMTFAAVFAVLTAVALAACAVPAVRAARFDPLIAPRHE
jgi:ABC-type antimicrobial peptide transport system permease subunit